MSTGLKKVDVCILGAGMAGLTLAHQLRQRRADLDIAVLEHRRFPVPEATHKVGESTVEIAAHYLSESLGLGEHLRRDHLPKFGLRLFIAGEQPIDQDLARYDEIGVSKVLPIPTFQLDRGRLENHLADSAKQMGIRILDGTTVQSVSPQAGAHQVKLKDSTHDTIQARYLIDSSGRRGWLRGQQNLSRPVRHGNHAVWYRIDGDLPLDDWSQDRTWQQRCHGSPRRFSTNHFSGPGYWVWLIPLASGTTSVGLVFDPQYVALDAVNKHERLLAWLADEQPLLAQVLGDRAPLDFHVLKNYAVGCQQNFSADGWMLTGDAGMFSDPFYSPGADFIAFANGFITELIAGDQQPQAHRLYQGYLQAFFSNTLSLYRGQYGGFGDRDMMVLKTIWDYAYYWGPLAKLYFSGRFTDVDFMQAAQPDLIKGATLNTGMQKRFRQMAQAGRKKGGQGRFFDHHHIPMFHRIKAELEQGDHPGVPAQLNSSISDLQGLSESLQQCMYELETGTELPDLQVLGQRPAFA
ncbi:MAG: FAD-dependent oxidoreductase [Pseudomonadota bacterium]